MIRKYGNKLLALELELKSMKHLSTPRAAQALGASGVYDSNHPIQLEYHDGVYVQPGESQVGNWPENELGIAASVEEAGLDYQVESFEESSYGAPEDMLYYGQSGEETGEIPQEEASLPAADPALRETSLPEASAKPVDGAPKYPGMSGKPVKAQASELNIPPALSDPGNRDTYPPKPDGNPSADSFEDDEFVKEIQSILDGKKVYDPQSRTTVDGKNVPPAVANPPTPPASSPEPLANQSAHSIFDQIAANIASAQAFDLGSFNLEQSLEVIEQEYERQEKRKQRNEPAIRQDNLPDPPRVTLPDIQEVEPLSTLEVAEYLSELNPGLRGHDEQEMGEEDRYIYQQDHPTIPDSPPVTQAFIDRIARTTSFTHSGEINQFFQSRFHQNFLDWFHHTVGGRQHWNQRNVLTDAATQSRFNAVWNHISVLYGRPGINLVEFLALTSIMIHETGGDFIPGAEAVNGEQRWEAPGIAYAFNAIPRIRKASYNTLTGNLTAYDLFHNDEFMHVHRALPLADRIRNTTDARWRGTRYPCAYSPQERAHPPAEGIYPVSTSPAVSGIILEADFYKFRGRGLIQTTTRSNYKRLIQFIQEYRGSNAVVQQYQQDWQGRSLDSVASTSTNQDWDTLFKNTDLLIPSVGIHIHSSHAGNYLNLPLDANGLNGEGAGSIYRMGLRINGAAYARRFKNRVLQIIQPLS